MSKEMRVRRLSVAEIEEHAYALGALFVDAVSSGASIGFMAGLTQQQAAVYWSELAAAKDERAVLIAEDAQGIAGVVVLVPNPNAIQPHRADIAKMVVHSRARGQGLAKTLMSAAEQQAQILGRTVLTLMTRQGSDAEQLYRKLGWQLVGAIPDDSLQPDGTLCNGVIYCKRVASR